MSVTALLVSSDPGLVATVREALGPIDGLALRVVGRPADAAAALRGGPAALVLAHLPDGDDGAGVARLLREVAAAGAAAATVVLSDAYRAEQALALLRQGAADYLARPLDLARLAYLADALTVRARLLARRPAPAPVSLPLGGAAAAGAFLYQPGGAMGRVMEQVRTVAPQETTVLLGGETGTGKTCLARLIHDLSPRRGEPFLVVNCGALALHLVESELFGHAKGAFTGAERDRVGKFEAAGAGTLLLDEIDALPPPAQAKLLRVVEERAFEPIGSNRTQAARARLVVASNRSLEAEVAAGRFRSDLYYRINVVAFYLPPLRERRAVVPALARAFVAEFAARNGRPARGLSAGALEALQGYDWPGNVRELRNVVERAVALCPGPEVGPDGLPDAVRAAGGAGAARSAGAGCGSGTLGEAKEGAEAAHILEALRRHKNNRLRAARQLGISRMTLYKKLHKYGLMADADDPAGPSSAERTAG